MENADNISINLLIGIKINTQEDIELKTSFVGLFVVSGLFLTVLSYIVYSIIFIAR
jgi:hypothetical protein